jgi:thymidylate synthase ThyX
VAAYVVPNAFNRRVLFRTNLREVFHFIHLRCSGNAHFSIRRVGRGMLEAIHPLHPFLSAKLNLKNDESVESLTRDYFSAVAERVSPRGFESSRLK